jgi:hypothetical protein
MVLFFYVHSNLLFTNNPIAQCYVIMKALNKPRINKYHMQVLVQTIYTTSGRNYNIHFHNYLAFNYSTQVYKIEVQSSHIRTSKC